MPSTAFQCPFTALHRGSAVQNTHGNISPGIAGLTLTYAGSLIWGLQGLLQVRAQD